MINIIVLENFDHAAAYHRIHVKAQFNRPSVCFEAVTAFSASEGAAEKTVRDAGLQVNTLTAEERAQMIEATKSVWDKYRERAGEIGQKLVAIAKDPKTFQ